MNCESVILYDPKTSKPTQFAVAPTIRIPKMQEIPKHHQPRLYLDKFAKGIHQRWIVHALREIVAIIMTRWTLGTEEVPSEKIPDDNENDEKRICKFCKRGMYNFYLSFAHGNMYIFKRNVDDETTMIYI